MLCMCVYDGSKVVFAALILFSESFFQFLEFRGIGSSGLTDILQIILKVLLCERGINLFYVVVILFKGFLSTFIKAVEIIEKLIFCLVSAVCYVEFLFFQVHIVCVAGLTENRNTVSFEIYPYAGITKFFKL